jgi:hypothetical protein
MLGILNSAGAAICSATYLEIALERSPVKLDWQGDLSSGVA